MAILDTIEKITGEKIERTEEPEKKEESEKKEEPEKKEEKPKKKTGNTNFGEISRSFRKEIREIREKYPHLDLSLKRYKKEKEKNTLLGTYKSWVKKQVEVEETSKQKSEPETKTKEPIKEKSEPKIEELVKIGIKKEEPKTEEKFDISPEIIYLVIGLLGIVGIAWFLANQAQNRQLELEKDDIEGEFGEDFRY